MDHSREEKMFQTRKINARSKVLLDQSKSFQIQESLIFHMETWAWGHFKNVPHQAISFRHLQVCRTSPGKLVTLWHVKGKFQYLFNRVETFVAMKCRSAVSVNLLCCYSIFIISYKIQSDLKITMTLTRLNLMGCPLQMNSPVNNLCLWSLMCGFSQTYSNQQ